MEKVDEVKKYLPFYEALVELILFVKEIYVSPDKAIKKINKWSDLKAFRYLIFITAIVLFLLVPSSFFGLKSIVTVVVFSIASAAFSTIEFYFRSLFLKILKEKFQFKVFLIFHYTTAMIALLIFMYIKIIYEATEETYFINLVYLPMLVGILYQVFFLTAVLKLKIWKVVSYFLAIVLFGLIVGWSIAKVNPYKKIEIQNEKKMAFQFGGLFFPDKIQYEYKYFYEINNNSEILPSIFSNVTPLVPFYERREEIREKFETMSALAKNFDTTFETSGEVKKKYLAFLEAASRFYLALYSGRDIKTVEGQAINIYQTYNDFLEIIIQNDSKRKILFIL